MTCQSTCCAQFISWLQVGQKTHSADRILGCHFFSPAHVMPLLEIVRTNETSKQVHTSWPAAAPHLLLCQWLVWLAHQLRRMQGAGRPLLQLQLPGLPPAPPMLHREHLSTLEWTPPCTECMTLPAQVILDTIEYGSRIKKTPVVVRNCTGFAVNRVFFPYTQASPLTTVTPAPVLLLIMAPGPYALSTRATSALHAAPYSGTHDDPCSRQTVGRMFSAACLKGLASVPKTTVQD